MAATGFTAEDHQPIPSYPNANTLKIVLQAVFVALVGLLFWWLIGNMLAALRRSNIPLGFDFLSLTAGFAIADTAVPYQATDTYARAFLVGIVNTLRVCAIGIVVATILGVIIGIGR